MKVTEIMTRRFETVPEDLSLLEAMERLRESGEVEAEVGIKCVIVVDGAGKMTGVLTQSDVVREMLYPYFVRDLTGERPEHPKFESSDYEALAAWARRLSVGEVMTKNPASIEPGGTGFEAADLLLRQHIKALPVVEDGRVAGIVYRSSLYRRLSEGILQSAPSPQRR